MNQRNKRRLSYPMFPFKESGDSLGGRIVERSTVQIGEHARGRYVIADEEGELWLVHGSAQMDDALDRASGNALLEIIYQGTFESASGFPTRIYEVYEVED